MSLKTTLAGMALAGLVISQAAGTAMAVDNTMAEQFAAARLSAFGQGDVAALVAQYADDAIFVTPMGMLSDRASIEATLKGVVAEFSEPGAKFEIVSQTAVGDIYTLVWSGETARNVYDIAAETYVLKDGKIAYQTLAMKARAK